MEDEGISATQAIQRLCNGCVTLPNGIAGSSWQVSRPAFVALRMLRGGSAEDFDAMFNDLTTARLPVHPDNALSIPSLGTVWLAAWSCHDLPRYAERRQRLDASSAAHWPDALRAITTVGGGFSSAGLTRLVEEATQAAAAIGPIEDPWKLRSTMGQAFFRAFLAWNDRGEGDLDFHHHHSLFRQAIRCGQVQELTSQGEKAQHVNLSMIDMWWGPTGSTPDTRLANIVDTLAFMRTSNDSTVTKLALKHINTALAGGGKLNTKDTLHASRLHAIGQRWPALHATLRSQQAGTCDIPSARPRLRP